MVETDGEMLGARARTVLSGELDAALIVFKHLTDNLWLFGGHRKTALPKLLKKVEEINNFTESRGEGNILGLSGAEGYERLHLGCPQNWASSVKDDIASPGMSRQRIIGRSFLPGSCPVSINKTFKPLSMVRFESKAFVFGS